MEKLLMLLDIYEEEVVGVHFVGDKITEKDEAWICSKKFGFIKRLVENDKIDLQKVMERNKNGYDITRVNPDDNFIDNAIEYDDELDLFIIMLLAISSSPIDDLIQLLK